MIRIKSMDPSKLTSSKVGSQVPLTTTLNRTNNFMLQQFLFHNYVLKYLIKFKTINRVTKTINTYSLPTLLHSLTV